MDGSFPVSILRFVLAKDPSAFEKTMNYVVEQCHVHNFICDKINNLGCSGNFFESSSNFFKPVLLNLSVTR